jgi:uncharacterized protein
MGHLNCRYLTSLDLKVVKGILAKPAIHDPGLDVLIERGRRHEQGYLEHLQKRGLAVTTIDGVGVDAASFCQTLAAIKSGAPVIAQAALQSGQWGGRADVLLRVEKPSELGSWSYEVVDTKLARETKGGTILQLSLYADLLATIQGSPPEWVCVVTPEADFVPQRYRTEDFAAYYRQVRRRLEEAVASDANAALYPDPNPHCEVCRWRVDCDSKRRIDDHLSLVAGISKAQIGELAKHGVATTADLAELPLPLQWTPERGTDQGYKKVREQARVQVEGRARGRTIHETLPVVPGFGLCALPAPSPGDVFLDLEGDPFVASGGLEFLFGYAFIDGMGNTSYSANWTLTRGEEKAAFEKFVDVVMARLTRHPDLHVYHYAPYEPAALKRLMGRYATRESEIDHLLRNGVFVDLYAVVRHGIRASVESYSIKKLEPLYNFERCAALADVGRIMAKVQACLELDDHAGIDDQDRQIVQAYNRDDCLSAKALRDWLEAVRGSLIASGANILRPVPKDGNVSEKLSDHQQKVAELVERLTQGISLEPGERTADEQARWILAYLLDWHRREKKATWWEFFRLRDLSAEDLLDERVAVSSLEFIGTSGGTDEEPIHRYRFPAQETRLHGGEELQMLGGGYFGEVVKLSTEERTIDVQKGKATNSIHPQAAFAHKNIRSEKLADALLRLGEHVADHGIDGSGPYRVALDLLLRARPRVRGKALYRPGEDTLSAAVRLVSHLEGVLAVQGPPGTGKTYAGARMICKLVAAGKKVGVTANSHKVIRNLLDETVKAAGEFNLPIRCVQRVREREDPVPGLRFTTTDRAALSGLAGDCHVAGSTAWLWSGVAAHEVVDALFIDEAAQMSLANVLAVSQGAKAIVLLGDPRQLEQPMQGSHPEGTDVSALDHILGGHATIPPDIGLFLGETWRLHPTICSYTSEMFYEGRLFSRPGLDRQMIMSSGRVAGSGLRYLPVPHQGNQSSSPEEANAVRDLVQEVLRFNSTWIDYDGKERTIELDDILIITPYNAQVFELQDRLPGARIGTVDKFQGQEAPFVIYSTATSSHADAPRGMEFLYSANRLNVATSRAKCMCVLVAAPAVFEAECRTPKQMQLANAFCRYLELAETI